MKYLNYRTIFSNPTILLVSIIFLVSVIFFGKVNVLIGAEIIKNTNEENVSSEMKASNGGEIEIINREDTGEVELEETELRKKADLNTEENTEPERSTSIREGIVDEGSTQIEESEKDIIVEDDDDRIDPAQDYNSTRSNRRKNAFFNPNDGHDPDDDGDGIITVYERNSLQVRQFGLAWRCSIETKTGPEGDVYCWGNGVRAAAIGEENDDGSVDTDTRVLSYLQVRANEVRDWSAEERSALRAYRKSEQDKNTPEEAAAVITEKVFDNEKIQEMEISEEGIKMRYRARMSFFGLFSITRNVDASLLKDGDFHIDFPWYSFIFQKPDNDNIKEILGDTMSIAVRTMDRTDN